MQISSLDATACSNDSDGSNQTLMDTLNGENVVNYAREWGTKGGTYLVNAMGAVLSWTLNIGLGLVIAIYMLLDKERLMMQGKRIVKAYASDEIGKSC